MKKWKLFFGDIEKQEAWINGIQLEGYQLTGVGTYFPVYHFAKFSDEPAPIRIDFMNYKSRREFLNYLTLFEDYGWIHLSGSRWGGFQYFRKVNPDGEDGIFSDQTSEKLRKKRYFNYSLSYGVLFFFYSVLLWNNFKESWVFREGIWQAHNIAITIIVVFLLLFYILPSLFLLTTAIYYLISSLKLSKSL